MPKKKGKAPISPPWALIKALAAVAARYGKLAANRQETNVSTLWASQAIDVVDVIVNHYIGQTADDLSWADVVDKVLGILDEWPETVDGWRQYAQRAIALGGVVAVAYRPLIYGALREFGRGNFASLADLRGATAKIEPSETMLRETVEFIRAMGVEKWAAAVKYLVDAEAEADVVNDGGAVAHSIDFRSVNWHGTKYTFTANQAACVKIWF
ncbi:MAG TPA: hypothetical protein VFW87_13085, partial [Pirellulales bacterium]|nr:hypothetical protein [Pirellulales bacterium]